jgi:hypothetical protein
MTDSFVIGRDIDLGKLEMTWTSNANFIQLVAPGGTGKTALMNHWYRPLIGEVPIFGWSFYKQGTSSDGQENSNVSFDPFLLKAIDWFGLTPKAATADARVEALVHHLRHHKTLLILDGLEPLQQHPSGELRDFPLVDLLRELAAQNAGLVLCTTRIQLADVASDGIRF